ncbi:MAG: Calx-beta domain-containing protein [Pyrinomonadaceae bacterium]
MTFGSTAVGSTSAEQSYTVSGSNLTANLVVTAPTDYEVSTTTGTGFGSSVSLTPSSGTVNTTTIFVRYAPATIGANSGTNITNASTGATTKNVAVTGAGINPTRTWTGTTSTDWNTAGNWNPGGVPASGDLVVIGTASNQPTLATATPALGTVTINTGGTLTVGVGGTLATNTTMTVNSGGTLTVSGGTTTITAASLVLNGTLNVSSGVLNVGTVSGNALTYGNGANITISGTGAVNVASQLAPTANTASNLINYTQSGGTVTLGINGVTGSNTFGIPASGSFFTMNGGAIVLQDDSTLIDFVNNSINAGVTGGTVQFGNSNTPASSFFVINSVPPVFNFTLFTGTTLKSGVQTNPLIVKGDLSIQSGHTFDTSIEAQNVSIAGNWTQAGTFTTGTGTVTFNGSSSYTRTGTGGFGNIAVNSGSLLSLGSALTVSTAMTVNGTLLCGIQTVSGAGSFTLASGATLGIGSTAGITASGATGNIQTTTRSFNTGAGYVYNGGANQAAGNGLPASVTNLTIADTGISPTNVVTGATAQTVTGAFNIQQGTYLAGTGTLAVGGNFSNSGTFTHNNGTVSLNGTGAQTIAGNTTFNILSATASTARTLSFTAASTTTVAANLILTGASGQLLSLRSTIPGVAWNLVAPAAQTVNFADARDSNAGSGQTVRATNSVDTANNVNWSFSAGIISFFGAPYTDSETNADHPFSITIRRGGGVNGTVSVNYAITDGTATTAGNDYSVVSSSGTLTWNAGDSADKTLTITVKGDTIFEAGETVNLTLSNAVGTTITAPNPTTLTITNDDTAPTISIGSVSVSEAGGNAVFTVTQSAVSGVQTSFLYSTADVSATAGSDYTGASNIAGTIAAGATAATISIPVAQDAVYEGSETFTVTLSAPANATIATGTGTATITDDEIAPTVTINDVTQAEGDSGASNFTFTITRTGDTAFGTVVNFHTVNGTAAAGTDYTAIGSGAVTFSASETTKTVNVSVSGDAVYETNETFTVELDSASNAAITDGSGLGTITNDDAAPAFSINDVTIAEGDSGTTQFAFTVTKSGATDVASQVNYATADGTTNAAAGGASCGGGVDYLSAGGTLNFTAAQTQQTVTVNVCGDASSESNETFFVSLSAPSGASISDNQGLGTILNDDAANTVNVSLPTSLTALTNTVLTVPVTVSSTTGNNSYSFSISYNQSIISPAAISYNTAGTLSSGSTITPDTSVPGVLGITANGALSGAGTLIELKFNVVGTPANCTSLSFTSFTFDNADAVVSEPGGMCVRTGNVGGRVTYGTSPTLLAVPDVIIDAAGLPSLSATTGADGFYNLSGFGTGAYTLTPSKSGGYSAGAFSGFDASLAARHAVGIINLDSNQRNAADVSGNGSVTSFDASLIAQYAVGMTINQPNQTGIWKFIQPGKSYPNIWTDYASEDFTAVLKGDVSGNWTPSGSLAGSGDGSSKLNPVRVTMADASVTAGNEIVIPVNISDVTNRGVYSFDFEIQFDGNVFDIDEDDITALSTTEEEASAQTDFAKILSMPSFIEKTGALSRNYSLAVKRTAKGTLRITGYGIAPLEGAGELFSLKFRAKNGAGVVKSRITWSAAGLNEGGEIPVLAEGAVIGIRQPVE